jgi:hypothetical protein
VSRKQALETGADIREWRPIQDPKNGAERRGLCDHQQFGAGDATGWLGRLDSNRNIREIAPSLIRY